MTKDVTMDFATEIPFERLHLVRSEFPKLPSNPFQKNVPCLESETPYLQLPYIP